MQRRLPCISMIYAGQIGRKLSPLHTLIWSRVLLQRVGLNLNWGTIYNGPATVSHLDHVLLLPELMIKSAAAASCAFSSSQSGSREKKLRDHGTMGINKVITLRYRNLKSNTFHGKEPHYNGWWSAVGGWWPFGLSRAAPSRNQSCYGCPRELLLLLLMNHFRFSLSFF